MALDAAPALPVPRPADGQAACGRLSLTGLVKRYDGTVAVDGLDLEVEPGEFFALLGASGCGKTTALRMVAGFETPDAGDVRLDGRSLVPVPPHRRPVNTVFQSYALFPFLDVAANVGFGLRYQRVSRAEARQRVSHALELVELGHLARRRPFQLSGGQQQRVALARALVLEPTVLLLDEPLGALDAKLRRQLQVELKQLQRRVGTTFVYVTHDQEEALTMADRLAVLVDGRVEQQGTPSQVYAEPASAYVAGFLGTANLYDAQVLDVCGDRVAVSVAGLRLSVARAAAGSGLVAGSTVTLVFRPERVEVGPPGRTPPDSAANAFEAQVRTVVFRGGHTHVVLAAAGTELTAEVANSHGQPPAWLGEGCRVAVRLSPQALQLLPARVAVSAPGAAVAEPAGAPAGPAPAASPH